MYSIFLINKEKQVMRINSSQLNVAIPLIKEYQHIIFKNHKIIRNNVRKSTIC